MSNLKINENSTTLNGELHNFKNVFILDASVFPDIQALLPHLILLLTLQE